MYGRILDPATGLPLEKENSSSSKKGGGRKRPALSGGQPASAESDRIDRGSSGFLPGASGADNDSGRGYFSHGEGEATENSRTRPTSGADSGDRSRTNTDTTNTTPPRRIWSEDLPKMKGSDGLGNVRRTIGGSDSNSNSTSLKTKKSEKSAQLKRLSVKQLIAIDKKKQADKEFREAYSKAIYRPTVEERVKDTLEQYEQRMLFGQEPLGYEMSLQLAKKVTADSDLEQMQLQRHSNYFHKLCAEEKLEKDKEKHRKGKGVGRDTCVLVYAGVLWLCERGEGSSD